jgi:hypothetical protein
MKSKILVAYESDDSVTIRLTPEKLGILFGKIPVSELGLFFDGLTETQIYATDELIEERKKVIETWLFNCT